MGVNLPSTCTVTCDRCDKSIEVDLTEYAGDPDSVGVEDSDIEAEGWEKRDNGDWLCVDCCLTEEEDEDE